MITIYKNHKSDSQPNHSPDDLRQLKSLGRDSNVIVKRSDKCKGLVVIPKNDYVHKAQEITKGYEAITKNPTPKLEAQTKRLIKNTLAGKVPEKIVRSIVPSGSRTAELYGLPKTHKPGARFVPLFRPVEIPLTSLPGF